MKKLNIITEELIVAALGIVVLGIIETIALLKGVDGIMFGSCATGIGAIIGWVMKSCPKGICK